ncbi:MAG: YqgE/AlgH family protein [Bacteroidota bacterium]|nr:YqgE/AlgH family protein [Bacteroidota bacterium]
MSDNIGLWVNDEAPGLGKLLISEPFMADDNFSRSVIYITAWDETEGVIGFILNKSVHLNLTDVIDLKTNLQIPLFLGGPVKKDSLHFIYKSTYALYEGSRNINADIWWGGDFEALKDEIVNNNIVAEDYKFFLGYSGWGIEQLQGEMIEKSWIVTSTNSDEVFHIDQDLIWREVLRRKGGQYHLLSNFPRNPQHN